MVWFKCRTISKNCLKGNLYRHSHPPANRRVAFVRNDDDPISDSLLANEMPLLPRLVWFSAVHLMMKRTNKQIDVRVEKQSRRGEAVRRGPWKRAQ